MLEKNSENTRNSLDYREACLLNCTKRPATESDGRGKQHVQIILLTPNQLTELRVHLDQTRVSDCRNS